MSILLVYGFEYIKELYGAPPYWARMMFVIISCNCWTDRDEIEVELPCEPLAFFGEDGWAQWDVYWCVWEWPLLDSPWFWTLSLFISVAIWRSFSSTVLVSLDIACPVSAIFSSMVAVSVIMAAMAIIREDFSEKMDEVTSRGDPWEEPSCEVVPNPVSDAEKWYSLPIVESSRTNAESPFLEEVCLLVLKMLKEMTVFGWGTYEFGHRSFPLNFLLCEELYCLNFVSSHGTCGSTAACWPLTFLVAFLGI